MLRAFCCLLALLTLVVPARAELSETETVQAGNEFLDLDLEKLLTLKIDPNLASILDGHIHRAGEWMLSYRFMAMDMSGRDLTTAEVLNDYMVVPTGMTMDMHMLSAMYAPTDRFTLMVMLPYGNRSMDHVTRTGGTFTTDSSGVSDIGLMGNFVINDSDSSRLIFHGGLVFPTGSINERGDTPAGANQKLPYPMQLGSGTYDLMPGIMYQYASDLWTWGTRLKAVVRLGKNSNDYRLGNKLSWSGWVGYAWTPVISNLIKLESHRVGDIHGADPDLNSNVVPTADPNRFSGSSTDLHLVTEFYQMDGSLKGVRMSLELATPIHHGEDPTQLRDNWSVTAAIQWTF